MKKDAQDKMEKRNLAKAYEKYVKTFTPRPPYVKNCLYAFVTGGCVCTIGYYMNNVLVEMGIKEKDAGTFVTIGVIVLAQLLTGLGVFDSIAKFAGAGVIVPISGFANSMVAPAIEYKKEGPVLGSCAKLFTVAGPVLVMGITLATIVGLIYWIIGWF